jgi:hypothetical protein
LRLAQKGPLLVAHGVSVARRHLTVHRPARTQRNCECWLSAGRLVSRRTSF